jgi:hypothetical protein
MRFSGFASFTVLPYIEVVPEVQPFVPINFHSCLQNFSCISGRSLLAKEVR